MSTPRLDLLLQKWRFYKRCLVFFILVTVFSVSVALVVGFDFFTSKRDLGKQQAATVTRLQQADQAIFSIQKFSNQLRSRNKIEIRTREDELAALQILEDWAQVKTHILPFANEVSIEPFTRLIANDETLAQLQAATEKLNSIKQNDMKGLQTLVKNYGSSMKLIIATGLLTIVFGLILPMLVFYLIGKTLNQIRLELQHSVYQFLRSWTEMKAGFEGDAAFRNVDFWLQAALLLGQQVGQMSSHPFAIFTSELASILRLELMKMKASGPAKAHGKAKSHAE